MEGTKRNFRRTAAHGKWLVSVMMAVVLISSVFEATAQIQSINAVGFANVLVPPGYSLISDPLYDDGTIDAIIPVAPNGTTVIKVEADGFHISNYLNGWSDPQLSLMPGEGLFIHNRASTNFTITMVGAVVVGQIVNHLPAGHSICSSLVPQTGPLSSVLNFVPPAGTVIYQYNNLTQDYTTNRFDGTQWIPSEPSLAVGTAMRVRTPAAYDWFRHFTIGAATPPQGAKQALDVTPLFGGGPLWIEPVNEGTQKSAKRTQTFGFFDYQITQPRLASQTGEVNFFTFHNSASVGLVRNVGGTQPVTNNFVGQLYAGTGSDETSLAPAGPVARFQSGRIAAGAVKIPGTTGGETAYFQLRAWEESYGASYDEAVSKGGRHGKSAVFPLIVQSPVVGDEPGLPPPDANSFPSFNVKAGMNLTLRFSSIWVEGNKVNFTFVSEAGARYRIEYQDNLGAPWMPIGSDITAVSGATHTSQLRPTAPPNRFYRISRVP